VGTPFELTSTVEADLVVWWAVGELDMATERRLVDSVTASFANARSTVVVDLSQLTFVDASGVRALLQCHSCALARQVKFYVRSAEKEVAEVLELTCVTELLSNPDW
jgi:anti-sigma B factor antagonist